MRIRTIRAENSKSLMIFLSQVKQGITENAESFRLFFDSQSNSTKNCNFQST